MRHCSRPPSSFKIELCNGPSIADTLAQIQRDLQSSCTSSKNISRGTALPTEMDKCYSTFPPRTPPSTVLPSRSSILSDTLHAENNPIAEIDVSSAGTARQLDITPQPHNFSRLPGPFPIVLCNGPSIADTLARIQRDLQSLGQTTIDTSRGTDLPTEAVKRFSFSFSPRTPPDFILPSGSSVPIDDLPVENRQLDPITVIDKEQPPDPAHALDSSLQASRRQVNPFDFSKREVHDRKDSVILSASAVLFPDPATVLSTQASADGIHDMPPAVSTCLIPPEKSGLVPPEKSGTSVVDAPVLEDLCSTCSTAGCPSTGNGDGIPEHPSTLPSRESTACSFCSAGPGESAVLDPSCPTLSRTLDLVRSRLVSVSPSMPLPALRESARVLRTGFRTTPGSSDDILGVALRERNDGNHYGTNNCLLISLREVLVPDPVRLREMLAQHFCTLDSDRKLIMSTELLPATFTPETMDMDTLTAHCVERTLGTGHLCAELLLSLLATASQEGNLESILSTPCDIIFFRESRCGTYAVHCASFQYPVSQPAGVMMVMCNRSATHFERLLPASALSEVMTSELTTGHTAVRGRRLSASRFITASTSSPLQKENQNHPRRSRSPCTTGPRWRSPLDTGNRFAVLASLSSSNDDAFGSIEVAPEHSAQHVASHASKSSSSPRSRARDVLPRLVRSVCFVPTGQRPIKLPPLSTPDTVDKSAHLSDHRRLHKPHSRTLGDFLPARTYKAALLEPRKTRSNASPALTPSPPPSPVEHWPTPSMARNPTPDKITHEDPPRPPATILRILQRPSPPTLAPRTTPTRSRLTHPRGQSIRRPPHPTPALHPTINTPSPPSLPHSPQSPRGIPAPNTNTRSVKFSIPQARLGASKLVSRGSSEFRTHARAPAVPERCMPEATDTTSRKVLASPKPSVTGPTPVSQCSPRRVPLLLTECWGLSGPVSARLSPSRALSVDLGRPPPPARLTRPSPSHSAPAFSMPVRWMGRMHNVQLPTAQTRDIGSLPALILKQLCPDDYLSLLRRDSVLIQFHGIPPDCPPASPVIERLRERDEPRSWPDLQRLKHHGGFIEVLFRCRGGADSGQGREAAEQPPDYSTIHAWSAVDQSLEFLVSSQGPPQVMRSLEGATAQYLLRSCSLDMLTALHRLTDWPSIGRLLALRDMAIRTPNPSQTMPNWYVASSWIDVRINSLRIDSLGPSIQRLGQNPRPEELVPLLVELITRHAPALRGLRLDDHQYDTWQALVSNVKLWYNPSQSRYLNASILLPPEFNPDSWRTGLITGRIRLSNESYLTFNPSSTFVEAELDHADALRLIQLASTLEIGDAVFMAILAAAFSRAWNTTVQCRYGCEIRGPQRTILVDPRSQQCGIIVGVDLTTLLQRNRNRHTVPLELGGIVSLRVGSPNIPKAALHDLLRHLEPALRLIALDDHSDPGLIAASLVVGPLPRRWISDVTRSRERVIHNEYLESRRQHLSVQGMSVFFLRKNAEPPFAVYFACPNVEVATGFVTSLRQNVNHVQDELAAILGMRLPALFESRAPPECIEVLGEKGLRKLLTPQTAGGPPAHASA